jgi:3-methyl-2-oxobutanoate hydroxymethyltransferase
VRATTPEEADELRNDALCLEQAGVFGIVVEKIPAALAAEVARSVQVPVIGIGAGHEVDGQILVTQDMIGLFTEFKPRFVRRYLELAQLLSEAFTNYADDVRSGDFPSSSESY